MAKRRKHLHALHVRVGAIEITVPATMLLQLSLIAALVAPVLIVGMVTQGPKLASIVEIFAALRSWFVLLAR